MVQQTSDEKQAGRKRVQVVRVEMVKERSITFATNKVCRPEDAASILADFLAGADREHFVVMCLDNKNKVNAINVAAVVLGHNHPSGDPTPSREDVELSTRLVEAGRILGIEVLDHLVIGDDGRFTSMKERGLL